MKALNRNRIALLAGGALVAVAATGCSSSAKSAASGAPAAGSATASTTSAASSAATAPSTPAPGQPTVTVTAPGGVTTTTAQAGGASTAPAGGGNSTGAPAPAGHPVCDNAQLNASLAPAGAGQKASVSVIAVKNAGPTCTMNPLPYVWIVTSPTDVSTETRPMVPTIDPTKRLIILSGTTLYAAIDLNPNAGSANGNYGYLEVTANPTKNTSGKDVQDVQLAAPGGVAGAALGIYTTNATSAIDQIQYATTPEQ